MTVTKSILGKPILSDQLDAELGSKVVKLIRTDMERAAREHAARKPEEEQPPPREPPPQKAT